MPQTLPPETTELKNALRKERHILESANIPIITISASFRKELIKKYRSLSRITAEVNYSRAHYSMAEAIYQQAIRSGANAHLADPLNFTGVKDWSKVEFTETVGKLMARHETLKWVKDKIDNVVRNKLPITEVITPPLLYLIENLETPLISLHYVVGNIAASAGNQVLQVITDPHVRPQYLDPLPFDDSFNQPNPNLQFAVFDLATKKEFLQKAKFYKKVVVPDQITVTGPPVDPRISKLGKTKKAFNYLSPLNIAVTTGGLGQNLSEIKTVLHKLSGLLQPPEKIRLFLYAGTHRDFRNFYEDYARLTNIRVGNLDDPEARIRILYEDSIIDANDNLIKYMFPWADAVITKPSGDMAYEAVAAGILPLFIEPWGEWEQNILDRFTKLKICFSLKVKNAHSHIEYLLKSKSISKTQKNIHKLPKIFRNGPKNILKLHGNFPN